MSSRLRALRVRPSFGDLPLTHLSWAVTGAGDSAPPDPEFAEQARGRFRKGHKGTIPIPRSQGAAANIK
jgi:hypothetical protein